MKAWIWTVGAVTLLAGCYKAHGYGDDTDSGVPFVDQGLPVEVTVMTRLGALEAVPASGARVVVQDCDSERVAEATTNEEGVASFSFGDARCWTVTALLDDEARSVVRAPVPMPGPIVFPREAVTPRSDELVAYTVTGAPRSVSESNIVVDMRGDAGGSNGVCSFDTCSGSMYDRAGLGDGLFTALEVAWNGHVVNGAIGRLPAPVNSFAAAQVALPTPPLPVRSGGVVVRMPVTGEYFASASDAWFESQVMSTEPVGARFSVGTAIDSGSEVTATARVITSEYEWVILDGTEQWSPPTSAFGIAPSDHDACRVPRVSAGDIFLRDDHTVEIDIPPVDVRALSGTSIDTLAVEVGGAGHRGYLSLRTAGTDSLFWVIEPYEAGVFQLSSLPLLPDGVADQRGVMTRSVHVQVGVTSPGRAAFAHSDTANTAAPWWVRDGAVFGRLADFGLSDAECDEIR